jgi:hypothetical protein
MSKLMGVKVVSVNIIASLYIFNDKTIQLVNMHLSESRPKQFEDQFGNLWYASELTNFIHV